MDFNWAIEQLRQNKQVTRCHGSNPYFTLDIGKDYTHKLYIDILKIEKLPNGQQKESKWNPNSDDLLSNKWKIVDPSNSGIINHEKHMDFSSALKKAKEGHPICRSGWYERGIFVSLKHGDPLDTPNNRFDNVMSYDYLYIDTTRAKSGNLDILCARVPWTPSQMDLLADDWLIFNH